MRLPGGGNDVKGEEVPPVRGPGSAAMVTAPYSAQAPRAQGDVLQHLTGLRPNLIYVSLYRVMPDEPN